MKGKAMALAKGSLQCKDFGRERGNSGVSQVQGLGFRT